MVANQQENEHQMINSPFKWVGGKSRLRKTDHRLLSSTYLLCRTFCWCSMGFIWQTTKQC
jgi:hypothetical protein